MPPTRNPNHYDVVVLGAGFAGSLLAMILAKQGMRVAIVDRSEHPRFAIGESSTPAADFLLEHLVQRYQLDELRPLTRFGSWRDSMPELVCGCKRGFSYFWHGGDDGFVAGDDHRDELLVSASESREVADTQWYRADVDAYFFDVARKCGVSAWVNTSVKSIDHLADQDWRLCLTKDRGSETLTTSFIVDATGGNRLLLRELGVPNETESLLTHSSATFSHFDDVRSLSDWLDSRGAKRNDYPFVAEDSAVHHLFADGWMWNLGFENGRTSVGFVFDESQNTHSHTRAKQRDLNAVIAERPVLRELLGDARLASFPGRVFQTDRLQRLASVAAGSDWAALPFTAGFIDPLHSTGIAHSISGVQRLSQILLAESGATRPESLHAYSDAVRSELRLIDKLVWGCYVGLRDFRLFTAWSMIYFAVATTFEHAFHDNQGDASDGNIMGFLAADQRLVTNCVNELTGELRSLVERDAFESDGDVDAFVAQIRRTISPLNRVGLFTPPIANMYHRTAAK
ncbi:NAD(P)/FAD-dependent oxidoreductase [Novipirellula rosea]|uniref:FAD-dependent oxidoreductase n=1 Tax=Novipirellula rosea TaxID=1031540 RepID=A0ABP8NUZ7_9BACT